MLGFSERGLLTCDEASLMGPTWKSLLRRHANESLTEEYL